MRLPAAGRVWGLTMPRTLVLLFLLCSITMLFMARCGMDAPDIHHSPHPGERTLESLTDAAALEKRVNEAVKSRQAEFEREMDAMEQQVANLQSQLEEARQLAHEMGGQPPADNRQLQSKVAQYEEYLKDKIQASEVIKGVALNNEYELFPFTRFTAARLYLVDPGLGKRVVEKPIGYKKKELVEVVNFALENLNLGRGEGQARFSTEDFLEGIYRTEPALGTHYEVYFRDIDKMPSQHYRKVSMTRPYSPLHLMEQRSISTSKEIINLILPLAGRVEKFRQFLDRFARVCIRIDKRVYLTVVYFGQEGLSEVKAAISQVSKTHRFKNMKLVTLLEPFSRGRGLQVGAQSWTQGDVLMFLCDVDIVFSTDFLERCRLNTQAGVRLYYPIVFSLYNPSVVYSLQDMKIPGENEQLVISKDTGFWRDFGYGMACMYRSDFVSIKGFDEQIEGWGLEDVYLYRKFVRSPLMVARATDPGIFHLWHEKSCDPKIPSDQYRGCIRSKALNEASHAQLGMLAFKEEIDVHKAMVKDSGFLYEDQPMYVFLDNTQDWSIKNPPPSANRTS